MQQKRNQCPNKNCHNNPNNQSNQSKQTFFPSFPFCRQTPEALELIELLTFKDEQGNPHSVITTCDLYFKGLSLRAIEDHMQKIYLMRVSYPTIHRWVQRMIKNMKALEKEHSLQVGKTWHIDKTAREKSGNATEIVIRNHLIRKNLNISMIPNVTIQGSKVKNDLLLLKSGVDPNQKNYPSDQVKMVIEIKNKASE